MIAPIAEHYEKMAALRESSRHKPSQHALEIKVIPNALSSVTEQIAKLISGNPFFRDHDYSWATDNRNYRNPMEALLQYRVLTALSEIARDHPHYPLLGNICVRVASSGGANALSFESDGYRYAVMSGGMLKILWEFMHTWNSILPRKGRYIELPGINPKRGQWSVSDAFRCADKKKEEIDYFINAVAALADFEVPHHLRSRYKRKSDFRTKRAIYMGQSVNAADAFIILHEVGHILAHGTLSQERSLKEEIEADEAAFSLMIILASRDNMICRMLFNGPALAFAAMRHFNLVGRTMRTVRSIRGDMAALDSEIEMRFETELLIRSSLFSTMAVNMGLPHSLAATYDTISHEMFFVVETTKQRLLKWMAES